MPFIGIIVDSKSSIKNILNNKINKNNIISINEDNIDNIKNIKFETILINSNNKKLFNYQELLRNILSNTKYLIINTDLKLDLNFLDKLTLTIITIGLNQKATITASSIENDEIILCLQRDISDYKANKIEAQEIVINKLVENPELDIYDILSIFSILLIYNKTF